LPTLLVAHLQFAPAKAKAKNCKRATKPTPQNRHKITRPNTKEKKGEGITMAIRNAGFGAKLKVKTFNKLIGNRTVKCLEFPHYA
jgi:hypothetical protein